MEEKVNGIVIKSIDYGDNDKIITVFTLEKGVISASLKGVKKAGAKLKFASEPFCFAEFILFNKSGKNTVISASIKDGFYSIREDIIKFYCGCTVLSFIKTFLKEEIISKDAFILTLNALKDLAYKDINPKSVTARFLFLALRLSGYGLNVGGCISCGKEIEFRPFFDYVEGGFYCENCKSELSREINYKTYFALKKIETEDLSEEESVFSLRLLDYYITRKTEEDIKILKELLKM